MKRLLGLFSVAALFGVLLVGQAESAAGKTSHALKPAVVKTTIVVTAGKPSELAFTLSKTEVPVGTVVFMVHNAGKLSHTFKICTTASKTATANSCVGKVTALLAAGKSATLTVTFKTKGVYEFLCTVPGHAGAGMKGKLGIGVKPTTTTTGAGVPATTTTATTTSATTTTAATVTKPPATESLIGDPVAGAAVFASAGCGGCHTLAAAGSKGTVGPNLDALAPSQAVTATQVTTGGGFMPSFGATLSATQINNVAAYVYSSTHAS